MCTGATHRVGVEIRSSLGPPQTAEASEHQVTGEGSTTVGWKEALQLMEILRRHNADGKLGIDAITGTIVGYSTATKMKITV